MACIIDLFRHWAPRAAKRKWDNETEGWQMDWAPGAASDAPDRVREISVRELRQLEEYPLFVDVRAESEYLCGHIEGARNLSQAGLEEAVSGILPDRARPIVVYCAQGRSSAAAAGMLQKLGYQNVFSLKGGLFGWLEAGGILQTCKRS
jgi:rhodanese-related sulfurtransferase